MATATGGPSGAGRPLVERASPTDRAFLAMDTGEVPEQFGVILLLDPADGFDLERARRLVAERVLAVPRLRQRLVQAPFGCGGPVWVDDPRFDIARHVRAVTCPGRGDERALLDCSLSVVMTPLRRAAPLWSAVFITGLADGGLALVVVLHHVLSDGVGGLAILASLVDGPASAPRAVSPGPHRAGPGWPGTRGRAGCGRCAVRASPGACCAHPWAPAAASTRRAPPRAR